MVLPKLQLVSDSPGYAAVAGEACAQVEVRGGHSRYRREIIGAPARVNVQWQLDPTEYQYLLAFHRHTLDGGTSAFLADILFDGPGPVECEATFLSGPPEATGPAGLSVVVRAILEVKPPARNAAADLALVATYDDGSSGPPLLAVTPSQSSYAESKGQTAMRSTVGTGPARIRKDLIGNAALVDVQWRVGPALLRYLQAFFWTKTAEGSLPFRVNLLLDSPLVAPYKAYLVPGSFRLVGVKGMTHTVQARIEAVPMTIDHAADTSVVTLFDLYGTDGDDLLAALATFVNVDLAAIF